MTRRLSHGPGRVQDSEAAQPQPRPSPGPGYRLSVGRPPPADRPALRLRLAAAGPPPAGAATRARRRRRPTYSLYTIWAGRGHCRGGQPEGRHGGRPGPPGPVPVRRSVSLISSCGVSRVTGTASASNCGGRQASRAGPRPGLDSTRTCKFKFSASRRPSVPCGDPLGRGRALALARRQHGGGGPDGGGWAFKYPGPWHHDDDTNQTFLNGPARRRAAGAGGPGGTHNQV